MSVEVARIYQQIYHCVAKIPPGCVATYGQIAKLVNASGARQVGYALAATPTSINLPWHRVINAKGEISQRSTGQGQCEQRERLMAEGVMPNKKGRIDLAHYRWQPSFETLLDEQITFEDDDSWQDQPGFG